MLLSPREAAQRLGISVRRLYDIAEKCELLSGNRRKGKYHILSESAVSVLQSVVDDLIGLTDALQVVGMKRKRFLRVIVSPWQT